MNSRRFYALDILRSCCILVVTFYHVWETSFGQAKMLFAPSQSLFGLLTDFFLDYWGYSGIILPFLSFFLIGFSPKRLNWRRYLLVTTGIIGMMAHEQIDFLEPSTWSWNLYGYLAISLLVVQCIPANQYFLGTLSLLSILLLSVPVQEYQIFKSHFGNLSGQILIGDLDPTQTIGWGLIPWLSIPVLGFCMGRLLRMRPLQSRLFKGFKLETPFFFALAAILISLFPFRDNITITPTGFYYYVFSGDPWFFWSRFLVVLIWLRLSCLDQVNVFLARFQFVKWLSTLSWNRHFGICYFIEFAFLPLAHQWNSTFAAHPLSMDLFWFFILAATEFSTRTIVNFGKRLI